MRRRERLIAVGIALYFSVVGLVVAATLAPPALPKSGCISLTEVGKSVLGRPINLCHVGGSKVGAKHSLLIIGSVHGLEHAGVDVVDELVALGANGETDLWVVRDGNPDGYALGTRGNANKVDINRNFPYNFDPTSVTPGKYSGPGPASEPETKALMKAIEIVQPKSMITLHQPYGLIDCATGPDSTFSATLANLTGLPTSCIPGSWSGSPTKAFTGTITLWATHRFPELTAVAMEFAPVVTREEAKNYAVALRQY